MTDDLLRQLKEQHHNTNVLDGDLMRDAADEITRLREENEKMRAALLRLYEAATEIDTNEMMWGERDWWIAELEAASAAYLENRE